MEAEEIKPGDIVQLKSGGPPMTVTQIAEKQYEQGFDVWCEWFEGKKAQKSTFSLIALMKVPPPDAPVLGRAIFRG